MLWQAGRQNEDYPGGLEGASLPRHSQAFGNKS